MTSGVKKFDITEFYAKIAQLQPPCTDCESFSLCADEELACKNFSEWVRSNMNSDKPRHPSKVFYRKLFGFSARVSQR